MQWPLVSALLGIFAFNSRLPWLALVALAPLFFFFIVEEKIGRLIGGVIIFRLVFLLGTVYFIGDPLLYLISTGLFLGLPVTIWFLKKYTSKIFMLISLPLWWVIWDLAQARWTPLPTAIVMWGNALAETSLVGLSRFGGIVGLTFFAITINVGWVWLGLMWRNQFRRSVIITMASMLIGGWIFSSSVLLANNNQYRQRKNQATLTLVATPVVYTDPTQIPFIISELPAADLTVLPENLYESDLENYSEVFRWHKQQAIENQRSILGAFLRKENERVYMSAALFQPNGSSEIYNKKYLTITSETWPFDSWQPFYFQYGHNLDQRRAIFDRRYEHAAGEPKLLEQGNLKIATPICSELHYPYYIKILDSLGPNIVLHNSNNTWITYHRDQYLQLTNKLRRITAVWLQKPVAVTGISDYAGVFYPDGSRQLVYPHNGYVTFQTNISF
ncbi:MAG TPA: nitrilase-related carbon-nitrogen hydrolase [Candidatus Paceibacterota bacterium]